MTTTRRRRSDGELTRRRVLDAAVECILESGYYQTSTNEIARRAGVTWGALQHQFGTREALLLEVLNDHWDRLEKAVANAVDLPGDTLEERLTGVLGVLDEYYGRPEYLVPLQILLDLSRDPNTSAATRDAVDAHGHELTRAWQPLFTWALGDAAQEQDLVVYSFATLRGYLSAHVIASSITTTRDDHRSRELLVRGVAAAVRSEAALRGIALD